MISRRGEQETPATGRMDDGYGARSPRVNGAGTQSPQPTGSDTRNREQYEARRRRDNGAILTPRLGLIGDSASFGTRFQGGAMRERILIVDDDPSLAAAAIAPPTAALALLDGKGHVRALADIEAEAIRFAISHYRGQMSEIARRLHIGRSTLYRKLDSLGLDAEISDGKAPAL